MPAQGGVGTDDDRIRVTTWSFEGAGDAIGHHRHEFDYVVVPVTGGQVTVVEPDGSEREMEQVAGKPVGADRRASSRPPYGWLR